MRILKSQSSNLCEKFGSLGREIMSGSRFAGTWLTEGFVWGMKTFIYKDKKTLICYLVNTAEYMNVDSPQKLESQNGIPQNSNSKAY